MFGQKPYYTVEMSYINTPRLSTANVKSSGSYGLEEAQQIAKTHLERRDAKGIQIFQHVYKTTVTGKEKHSTKKIHSEVK